MSTRPHLIQKLNVEVTFNGVTGHADSRHWHDVVRKWLEQAFLPQLEVYLESTFGRQEEIIKIDTLQLDLGRLSSIHLSEQNTANALRLLEEAIGSERIALLKGKSKKTSLSEQEWEAFLFFLSAGRLPWWKTPAPADMAGWELQLSKALGLHGVSYEQIMLVFQNEAARNRLAHSFSKRFQKQLLRLLQAGVRLKSDSTPQRKTPESFHRKTASEIGPRQQMPSFPQEDRPDLSSETQKVLHQLLEMSGLPDSALVSEGIGEDDIYIQNAGVVLLHPFFQMLLEELGHAKAGNMLNPGRAIQLLQVLATGRTAPEYELSLNKLLCGVPLTEFVNTPVRLTKKETAECERLLRAAIGHWARLGDTSPDGLRGTFLCREGKLSRRQDNNWLLQVEQRGFDVLLNDLPWNISMIKLPWMQNMLFVEWV